MQPEAESAILEYDPKVMLAAVASSLVEVETDPKIVSQFEPTRTREIPKFKKDIEDTSLEDFAAHRKSIVSEPKLMPYSVRENSKRTRWQSSNTRELTITS